MHPVNKFPLKRVRTVYIEMRMSLVWEGGGEVECECMHGQTEENYQRFDTNH